MAAKKREVIGWTNGRSWNLASKRRKTKEEKKAHEIRTTDSINRRLRFRILIYHKSYKESVSYHHKTNRRIYYKVL